MQRTAELAAMVGLTAFDQAVKALTTGLTLTLIPGVVRLHYTQNTGFSLGLFSNGNTTALLLSMILLVLIWLYRRQLPDTSALRFPLLLICAGALGNVIDRLCLGYVRDMIELLFIRFYVFNPADTYVTGGAILSAVALLWPDRKEKA